MPKSSKQEKASVPSDADEVRPSRKSLIAQAATRPSFLAANTISSYNQVIGEIDLMEMVNELNSQISRLQKGDMSRIEETLGAQAMVLDTLFNTLSIKALQSPELGNRVAMLKLALQAQRQCCQTIEALSAIKNPPAVTVVRQTNIGQAVQVNNGKAGESTQKNLENKLLENPHDERLDSGTQNTTVPAHQDMATMATVDRTKERSRQSQSIA